MVKVTLYKHQDVLVIGGDFQEDQKLEWMNFLKASGLGAGVKSKQPELGKMQYNLYPGVGEKISSRHDIPSFVKIKGNEDDAAKNNATIEHLNYRASLCPDCGREMESDGGIPYCEHCDG